MSGQGWVWAVIVITNWLSVVWVVHCSLLLLPLANWLTTNWGSVCLGCPSGFNKVRLLGHHLATICPTVRCLGWGWLSGPAVCSLGCLGQQGCCLPAHSSNTMGCLGLSARLAGVNWVWLFAVVQGSGPACLANWAVWGSTGLPLSGPPVCLPVRLLSVCPSVCPSACSVWLTCLGWVGLAGLSAGLLLLIHVAPLVIACLLLLLAVFACSVALFNWLIASTSTVVMVGCLFCSRFAVVLLLLLCSPSVCSYLFSVVCLPVCLFACCLLLLTSSISRRRAPSHE